MNIQKKTPAILVYPIWLWINTYKKHHFSAGEHGEHGEHRWRSVVLETSLQRRGGTALRALQAGASRSGWVTWGLIPLSELYQVYIVISQL